jgi:hypothetical protein
VEKMSMTSDEHYEKINVLHREIFGEDDEKKIRWSDNIKCKYEPEKENVVVLKNYENYKI